MNQELYEPTVIFFRLTNSLATFQTMMDIISQKQITQGTLIVYMDNIAIHTRREWGEIAAQHLEWHWWLIKEMLAILQKNDLYLNIEKCQFEKQEVNYLGV